MGPPAFLLSEVGFMDLSPILSVLAACALAGLARPFLETLRGVLASLLPQNPSLPAEPYTTPGTEEAEAAPLASPQKERHPGRGLDWVLRGSLLPAFLLSGLVSDYLGARQGAILGSLGLSVGLAALGLSRGYRSALGAAALTGGGIAWLTTASLALLPLAYDPQHAPEWFLAAANAGFLFLTAARQLGSGLVPWLASCLGPRRSLLLLALLYLWPTLLVGLADNSLESPRPEEAVLWHDPRLWLVVALVFLYRPAERVLVDGRTLYLQALGATERNQRWASTAFALAFLGSRAILALVPLTPRGAPWLLWGLLAAGAVLLGNLAGFFHQPQRLAGPLAFLTLLGLCLGPVLPGLFGCTWQGLHGAYGTSTGLLLTALALADLGLAPLGGYWSRRWSGRSKLILVMVLILILLAPLLVLCVWED